MTDDLPRVLFVSTMNLDREVDSSAAARRWTGLANRFQVETVGFSRKKWGPFRRHGCRFFALPRPDPMPLRLLVYYLSVPVLALWRAWRGPTTIWIAQGPYEALAVLIPRILLGRTRGVHLIVEAHGDWIESFLTLRSPPAPGMIRALLRGLSRVVLRFADGLRSVSGHTRDLLATFTPHNPPHHTFPAYMDLEPFLNVTLEDKQQAESDTPRLLFVGALTELKGADLFLRTVREMKLSHDRLEAVLCGEGPERQHITSLVDRWNLGDRVTFPGYVDRPSLRDQYLRAHVLVLPSRMEGYGRVIVEALACYTPVVATPTGGARELLSESRGGRLAEEPTPESLARTLKPYLADRSLRREDGKRGRDFVSRTFDHDRFFRNYRELVHDVTMSGAAESRP